MNIFRTTRQPGNAISLVEHPPEKISIWLRVIAEICAALSIILLLLPSIVTRSVHCLALILSPLFLFAPVEIPRFQCTQLALHIIHFEVQPPQVSLFKRPP